MVARLYDALHDPARSQQLTTETDIGDGGRTHRFFVAPRSAEELIRSRDAIAAWARISYGWLSRPPDYKAAFTATLGPNAGFYAPFEENARHWYAEVQRRTTFLNHAIVHPPIDRDRPPSEVRDVFVHVERETDAGLVVSGAKAVATGAVLTHANLIAHHGPAPVRDPAFAVAFFVPTAAPGLKLVCRPSYEYKAAIGASPWDAPLSSRFDENDVILVLDRVLVPWGDVLLYGDLEKANAFLPRTGAFPRLLLHGCTRLAVKLDFIAGLLMKAVEVTGTAKFWGVEVNVGEVIVWRNLFWALSEAMARNPRPWRDGYVLPDAEAASVYQALAPQAYGRVRMLIERTVASGLIYSTSSAMDFTAPQLQPYLEQYLRGSDGHDASSRDKLTKLLWDAVGSEFAGRHELYEMNNAGTVEEIRRFTLRACTATGVADQLRAFVDRCLSEYDLEGWTTADLVDNGDVSAVDPGSSVLRSAPGRATR